MDSQPPRSLVFVRSLRSKAKGSLNEAGSLPPAARNSKTSKSGRNADDTSNPKKMTSFRALVALAVALMAASTGKVPLLSPPVRAVLSFVRGGGSGIGAAFSRDVAAIDDDGGTGHLRASRLLSIALRNATSDYDEVRGSMLCFA